MADESTIHQALRGIVDPGLSESIVDLGWITRVRVQARGRVLVAITPPTPAYPHAEILTRTREAIEALPGVRHVEVQLVWNPPWTPYRMTNHLKATLGLPNQEPAPSVVPSEQPGSQRPSWLRRRPGR